jgi:cobalt-zinc-cadmium efflux system membrane fusion protein
VGQHDSDHHNHEHGAVHHGSMRVGGRYLWIGAAVGIAVIALLYAGKSGLFGGHESKAEPAPFTRQDGKITIPKDSPLRQHIAFAPAATRSVGEKLSVPAVVEADPARSVAVLPPLGGRLAELKVGLGDRVSAGQVLAVIDSPDLAQAYDDDEKAADSLALTEKTLKRQEQQAELGTLSAHDLDQAKSDNNQAKAEYARTQARLKDVGAQAADHHRLVVRAPVAGSVTALTVAQGAVINDATQPLMTVADLSTVWVTALVPERNIGEVAKGQAAEVTLEAYPGKVLKGQVQFVSDVIEPDSRRDKVRLAFTNPGMTLKPNMFGTVTLQGTAKSQVVLPTSALLMNNDRTTVFVETGDWVFERRVVDPSLEDGPEVAISSGVAAGEQVVVKGGLLLND